MKYIRATENEAEQIALLVQETIKTIYPKYYPLEVVDFFLELHAYDNILRDIREGVVGVLLKDDVIVGTGCSKENHITRVYVSPKYQKQGFGSYIMQCLEDEIGLKYEHVVLDSSLPASHLYEKRGYKTIKHERWSVRNGVVLVYEIMEKQLPKESTAVSYNGKFFVPRKNSENGEVDERTLFEYHQRENVLWADYSGGDVLKGHMVGVVAQNGELDFYYQHINAKKEVRIGVCHSVPQVLENGKIQLLEKWQWLNGDKSEGTSIVVEKESCELKNCT